MQSSTVGNSWRQWARGSPDNDPAFQVAVVGIVVVVEAAGPDDVEVASFAALTLDEHADLVDGWALLMIGMVIRRHVMTSWVVIDEENASAGRDGELFR